VKHAAEIHPPKLYYFNPALLFELPQPAKVTVKVVSFPVIYLGQAIAEIVFII
jgi:hypothetical protein